MHLIPNYVLLHILPTTWRCSSTVFIAFASYNQLTWVMSVKYKWIDSLEVEPVYMTSLQDSCTARFACWRYLQPGELQRIRELRRSSFSKGDYVMILQQNSEWRKIWRKKNKQVIICICKKPLFMFLTMLVYIQKHTVGKNKRVFTLTNCYQPVLARKDPLWKARRPNCTKQIAGTKMVLKNDW